MHDNRILTNLNIDLESFGFKNLPKNIHYFKFEADANEPFPLITLKRYVRDGDLKSISEKKYILLDVETEDKVISE